jgi:hypothetical protein
MTIFNKGIFSLCVVFIAFTILITGCEDPGSVGSEFVESPQLTFDTLNVEQTELLSYSGYSGGLNFIPMGYYSDALFGEVNAIGLFRPIRTLAVSDTIEIKEDFDLKLQLQIDSLEVYGDTLSTASYSVREVSSIWRENALTIDYDIQLGNEIGQFTISPDQDQITIDLSDAWVDEYKTWYFSELSRPDSAYSLDFNGLAIVPDQQSSKISFAQASSSRFMLINYTAPDTTDTLTVSLKDHGYILDRSGQVISPNTVPIHTTLEGMLNITLPVAELEAQAAGNNIIRVDLVFYEARTELESSLPTNHSRLPLNSVNFDLYESFEPAFEYQFGQVEFRGTADPDEDLFRANITTFVNNILYGEETRNRLVLGAGLTSGAVRSSLFYDITAPENVRPKIIITSLED